MKRNKIPIEVSKDSINKLDMYDNDIFGCKTANNIPATIVQMVGNNV